HRSGGAMVVVDRVARLPSRHLDAMSVLRSRRRNLPNDHERWRIGPWSNIVATRWRGFIGPTSTKESPMMSMFKPGAWGFVIGSIVTMIVGFSWGGWSTSSTADRLATERSTVAVTAALVPVCLEKSKADPAGPK